MNTSFKKVLLAVVCSSTLLFTACGGDDNNHQFIQERTYISNAAYTQDSIQGAVIRVMSYKMPNVADQKAEATAMVFYPSTPRPADGWRVVVWEHGTVGIGDECAPSVNTLNPRFKTMAESLLAEGYVIVAPDYEGLGSKGIHPYLHLESAAQSAIYAVRALKDHLGSQMNGAWMSVGQSQGGHASLGTAEFANQDPNYKGAVAAAPASSLGYIISEIAPEAIARLEMGEAYGMVPKGTARNVYAELMAYAAYVAVGIKAYEPNFNYHDIFQEASQATVMEAEGSNGENGKCLGDLMASFQADIDQFTQTTGKAVMEYPGLTANFQDNPIIKQFLAINQPATKKLDKPIMVIQGEADTAVPADVTTALVENLRTMGTVVDYQLVPLAGHTQAIVERNAELVRFIKTNMPAQ
ncbi:MAG: prolyl oligopeptidase family serine peptidase [Acinetobacter sp.]|uniref:alpha/beta hydrolase n=1 Tax=Acinetobacter sp. TaxID=472 RepID=UPI0026DFA76D|nr:prolyl oligopeptidase family serine peptidase [Acinetobacter sp.]MDO5542247.1 prolyl oligopeptidase family serine peptidase [Acinetobacter sp.]